jgi:hypothetical protein
MNLDWSKVLIGAMALFIIFIVSMGVKMATSSQALYEEDYYEQGELHAVRMEEERNAKDIQIEYDPLQDALDVKLDGQAELLSYRLTYLANKKQDVYYEYADILVMDSFAIALNPESASGIWVVELRGKKDNKFFVKKQQYVK